MATISFSVRNEATSHGLPIQMRISFAGHTLRFNTGVYISDAKNLIGGQLTRQEANYIVRNIRLKKLLTSIETFLLEKHTFLELKSYVKILLSDTETNQRLFIDVLDEFVSTKTKQGTIDLYWGTKKKILAYDPRATLDSIDRKWIAGIERMMSDNGLSINGYAIHLRNIRAVFNYALDEEYTNNYPFRKFKIKQETTISRALSVEQLKEIRDYECEEFQKMHRDMFMLMFYLIGINASDLFTLPKNAIDEQGRIVYHRAKTGKLYSIKVEPEALDIINMYKGKKYLLSPLDHYKNYKDYVHHMNNALKTIGKKWRLGIGWSGDAICPSLSGYWSRHTWATVAFNIGIPKDVISLALGHSFGLSVTDIYISYSTAQVDAANRKVLDYIRSNVAY